MRMLPPKHNIHELDIVWYIIDVRNQEYISFIEAISILTNDELRRMAAYKTDKLRKSFAIRRALLRKLLAYQLTCDIDQVSICYGEQGKPILKDTPIYFNMSDSGKYAIYAFSTERKLGIDIEMMCDLDDELATANHIMTSKEFSVYQDLQSEQATLYFYQCWTAKESYMKLLGLGLSLAPNEVATNSIGIEPDTVFSKDYRKAKITQINNDLSLDKYTACIATFCDDSSNFST